MTIDQMELLFQLLIAQNSNMSISAIFPGYFFENKSLIFGECVVIREKYGSNIDTVEIRHHETSAVRYRINTVDNNKTDFITWDKRGTSIFNVYEQYLSYLLKYVSFEDKV